MNSKYMTILKQFAFVTMLLFLFTACSEDEVKRDLKEHLSAYLNDNEEVIAFGNAKLHTILNKADYNSVGILNAMVGSQLESLNPIIDVQGPVYYAAHGPLKKDGSPEKVVIFVRVKDKEGLRKHLQSEMSFDLNDANGFTYASSGDMTLGFKEHLAIIVLESGNVDEVSTLTEAFKKAEGKVSSGKVAEVLKSNNEDIQIGMSVANLYGTSSGELARAPKSEREKLAKLFEGAFVNSSIKFEKGRAIVEIKNLFGKELEKKMFLAGDDSAPILNELGTGTPRIGFSMNMNVQKMESLVNELSPNGMDQLGGVQYMGLKLATGSKSLNDLWDGQMGFLMFGEPDESGAFTPEVNAFMGIREKGRSQLSELGKHGLSVAPIPGLPDLDVVDNGISILSNPSNGNGKLVLPVGAENFGKSGINFFINLDGLNADDIAEMIGNEDLKIALRVAKFISFEYNNQGGKLIILAKDGKENVLKQALNEAVKQLSSQWSI